MIHVILFVVWLSLAFMAGGGFAIRVMLARGFKL